MEYDRCGFVDAVESLAKTAGVEVPREERRPEQDRQIRLREQCFSLLEEAGDFYRKQLREHPRRDQAVKYLQQRGLSGQIAQAYGLGFAPPGWDNLLVKLGHNEQRIALLAETGLLVERSEENRRYDRFRHRIMFPIRDLRGRTIGFGGRVLGDDKPKYLNSPETPVFHKGRELYGLYEARKYGKNIESLIVVEGYMDVIALAQYGMFNAVATLGTACGEAHLELAFKQVSEVIFCFDGDRAGRDAARRALLNALPTMKDGRQIRFLFLADGQDPDSLVRQIGRERFEQQLQHALPLEDFLFDVAADGINLNSMDGRARFSKQAAPLIHKLPEGVFRSLMMDNLAKRTGLSLEQLQQFTDVPDALIPAEPAPRDNVRDAPSTPPPKAAPTPGPADDYGDIPELYAENDAEPPAYLHDEIPVDAGAAAQITEQPYLAPPIRSRTALSPARQALILLLEFPALLQQCEPTLNIETAPEHDDDLRQLLTLVTYLRKRPNAEFYNIMGFWAGVHGPESCQKLCQNNASQLFSSLKNLAGYDALKDLNACFKELNRQAERRRNREELQSLTAKGLANLDSQERQRYLQLIQQS